MTPPLTKFLKILTITALCTLATGLQSCFTGIESTPKITYKESGKDKGRLTPEQQIAAGFTPAPASGWRTGKEFYVTSDRAGLVLRGTGQLSPGEIITYAGRSESRSVTGGTVTDMRFTRADNPADTLVWRAPSVETPALPFLVDMDLIAAMRSVLVGNRYYIRTALWYTPDGRLVNGRKFIPVEIIDIRPYSADFPAMVTFRTEDGAAEGHVMMSENRPNATRTFDSLFAVDNPRRQFPQTTDDNWRAIQNSQTREGMTRGEVRAALGAPAKIDRGQNQSAAFERWTYTDGVTLMFVDGILSNEVM